MLFQNTVLEKTILRAGISLNAEMFPVFLGISLVAVLAWFILSRKLFQVLEDRFTDIYLQLGEPGHLVHKNSFTNYRVMKFILLREYELTGDIDLTRLCRGLRYILFIFALCVTGALILLIVPTL